ncbi:hypothetical protein E4T43_03792 [Aureobasidium subglaciale]|nr:hypothetical protein E4T43_03792 [Aureobasidium subglaciale]
MTSIAKGPSLLLSLPPELMLNSLARIDYTPGCLDRLRFVCHGLEGLLQQYEHSLAVEIIRLQFPSNVLSRYPDLHDSGTSIGFKTLDEICIRMYTLFRIERNCHNIRGREGLNGSIYNKCFLNRPSQVDTPTYFVITTGDHKNKSHIIRSLPPTSLAILLLTLHLCIHQLRSDGPSLLIPTSPLLHGMLRFEIEMCCQELVLQYGPCFLDALLCHCPQAIALLSQEVRNLEVRQLPSADGEPSEKTLIAECRCRLADTLGTDVEESRKDMWNVLERIGMLNEEDIVKVIRGEELVIRKRQDSGVEL